MCPLTGSPGYEHRGLPETNKTQLPTQNSRVKQSVHLEWTMGRAAAAATDFVGLLLERLIVLWLFLLVVAKGIGWCISHVSRLF